MAALSVRNPNLEIVQGSGEVVDSPELSIIIVNWNAGPLLRACVASVRRHAPQINYEIIVADNGSTDDSLTLLREAEAAQSQPSGPLRIREHRANLGFARANNLAIAETTAPFIFLLNPDTELKAGAVDTLLTLLKARPRVGLCAPRLLNPDGSLQPSVWPALPTPLYILVDGLRLYRWLPQSWCARHLLGTHWAHNQQREVEFFYGAAMLVRREVINLVGAFDEAFHMYGEDCEWCVRIKRGGWLLYFEPAAEVVHYGGHSATQRWTNAELIQVKAAANILFQRRMLPPFWFWLNQLSYALVLTIIAVARLPQGREVFPLLRAAKLHFHALWAVPSRAESSSHGLEG